MKSHLIKTGLLFFSFFWMATIFSQNVNTVGISSCTYRDIDKTVLISIKTTTAFIVGSNRYVLHIGGKHFLRNIHPDGRLDEIIFFIPKEEFDSMEDQLPVVLVYGYHYENTQQDKESNQNNGFIGKHWKLGKLDKKVLK